MKLEAVPECPLIEVSGPPFARGKMYGERAKERIIKGVSHYSEQLRSNHFSEAALAEVVKQIVPIVESFSPVLLEEMHGIAEGASIPFEHVMLLNARTEVLQLAARQKREAVVTTEPDGCTGVVVLPEATQERALIHAQNWDWKYECAETSVVLHVRREDGPDVLTFTEAGGLARAGFNSLGASITGNYLECERDYREIGMPLALLRRYYLDQSEWALGLRAIYATPKSASNNMIVCHAEGVALNMECAPDETFLLHPRDDGMFSRERN